MTGLTALYRTAAARYKQTGRPGLDKADTLKFHHFHFTFREKRNVRRENADGISEQQGEEGEERVSQDYHSRADRSVDPSDHLLQADLSRQDLLQEENVQPPRHDVQAALGQ